jgi:ribose transport system ATP-binding protein
VRGVDLDVRSGEILGVAGLVGSGRTQLARLIFGVDSPTAGTMQLQGREYRPKSPYDAIRQGVAMLPEERRSEALLLADSVERNIRLATLKEDRVRPLGLISPRRARAAAAEMVRRLSIKTASLDQPVAALSGGNQQKVVASRYMLTEPTVLILDEPTVGVDVGARQELHTIIRELADAGSAVVMISSDFDEFAFCERVALMREGRIVDVLDGADATKEHLTTLCYAVPDEEHPNA